jgi:hypothetical protein
MELGLYTFADVGPEIGPAQRLRNLLEEIELADQVGLDAFGVGTLPHDKVMRAIELFGTEVAPAVRKELTRRSAANSRNE